MIIKLVQRFRQNIKIFKKILLREIVFDNDFRKIKKIQNDVKENDDFKNAKIYKICKDINDVIHIGSTCFSLKKCLSNFKTKSKPRRYWYYDDFYNMIRFNYVYIELIENFQCDNANDSICKKSKVID